MVRVLYPELPGAFRQLHPRQSVGDTDAYRAGMVLSAVLRHSARHPEQASRRDGAGRVYPDTRVPALAGHFQGAVGALSSALSAVLLGIRHRLRRPWLAR